MKSHSLIDISALQETGVEKKKQHDNTLEKPDYQFDAEKGLDSKTLGLLVILYMLCLHRLSTSLVKE